MHETDLPVAPRGNGDPGCPPPEVVPQLEGPGGQSGGGGGDQHGGNGGWKSGQKITQGYRAQKMGV